MNKVLLTLSACDCNVAKGWVRYISVATLTPSGITRDHQSTTDVVLNTEDQCEKSSCTLMNYQKRKPKSIMYNSIYSCDCLEEIGYVLNGISEVSAINKGPFALCVND